MLQHGIVFFQSTSLLFQGSQLGLQLRLFTLGFIDSFRQLQPIDVVLVQERGMRLS
jgi:hypothetical protein